MFCWPAKSNFFKPLRKYRRRTMFLALFLDALGEPPSKFHPVVWMGHYLSWIRKRWQAKTSREQLFEGVASYSLGVSMATGVGWAASGLPWYVQGALLKPLLARKALFDAVAEIYSALEAENLPEARRLLAWHLVSRDTSQLSESEVVGACIESLSENLSDSVVAPLLAFRLGGLPLAAAYRLTNTADAMWGYRTPELEYAGKTAAHMDDLLNLVPARLTAVCALIASGTLGAWRTWQLDCQNTSSPNAGHPMSVFAGALDIRLDKRGTYVLNAGGRRPERKDILRALRLAWLTLTLAYVFLNVKSRW